MPGTSIGIFWIDFMCKPAAKELLKDPLVTLLFVSAVYAYIGYQVLKSTYFAD
jgi:hypothetical protein